MAFAAPFLIGFTVFIAYPIAASAYYSFTDFNLFQEPRSVGFDNYTTMLSDDRFVQSLANTAFLTVLGVPASIAIALAGAHILNLPVRGQPLFRAMVYLPTIVPVVVGGYLWRWLLNAQYGYVNRLLELVHLPQPLWLQSPDWTKPAIIVMSLWTVGGMTIIYLAALKEVPRDLYEAASVDGAGPWRQFRHITWPTLTPVTLFHSIVTIIAFLQIFTQPYLLAQTRLNATSGGPGDSMLSYSMYLFQNAFVNLEMGYASAMAWVLFLITMAVTAVLLATSKKWVHYGSR
ncbi:MAG: carbohydrate ABC transporter permease [Nocardioidaceae bacterium]